MVPNQPIEHRKRGRGSAIYYVGAEYSESDRFHDSSFKPTCSDYDGDMEVMAPLEEGTVKTLLAAKRLEYSYSVDSDATTRMRQHQYLFVLILFQALLLDCVDAAEYNLAPPSA